MSKDNMKPAKEIIDELLEKTDEQKNEEQIIREKYSNGLFAIVINEINSSGSAVFGILNTLNKIIFKERVEVATLIIVGNIVLLILNILFIQVLKIGENRYFLEQRRYKNTKIDKLLFPYKVKKALHLSYILFIKSIYQLLWNFTIIGGIIKHYEYSMIPYILAENPEISKKEAFCISKELTNGKKLDLFKLDLSLIGWEMLSTITLKISSIFYSEIYKQSLYAEAYMDIRNEKKEVITYKQLIDDELLNIEQLVDGAYPDEKSNNPNTKTRILLKFDYNRQYSVQTYIMLFFTFSFIGWIYEVFITLISNGILVNKGTLCGPWLPIYGTGGVLILILLKKFRDKPFDLFIAAIILCGFIEYASAWYLETFINLKYWDYTGYFLNLHGRVCLEFLIVFGIGGCVFTYLLAPIFDNLYAKIKPEIKNIICIILILIFLIDFIYCKINPRTGKGLTEDINGDVKENSSIETGLG